VRLLIVTQYFWPENFRVNDFALTMRDRGHDVTVLTGKPNYPDGYILPDFRKKPDHFSSLQGIPIHRVPLIPRGGRSWQLVLNYLSFAVAACLLGPWKLRGAAFDAIFVFQTSPITAALPALVLRRLKRAPVLMWILDLWPETLQAIGVVKSPRLLAWVGALVRFIYKRCDALLIQSQAFADNVRRRVGREDKLHYFPGWAEGVFAGPEPEPAAELQPFSSDFRIVFAGNLGDAQDLPSIIAAADILRSEKVKWLIVGEGRGAAAARAQVAERGLGEKVQFLGRFPLERMPSFFAGADALLVSLKDEPIFAMTIPGKVQSYLVSGKPILAMLNGEGARVVEESGAGLASPSGDARALADNVRRLMMLDLRERREMGRKGLAYSAREFDREKLLDQLETWMSEAGTRYPASKG
jgi:colanic acid biosynthesis glycosyl transferase WcaI